MSSHELNSAMMFIHPPLAIAGHVFVFLFALALFLTRSKERRATRFFGLASWLLTLLGLVTGMIWAQSAWGSYWSWDPKETLTLLLFVTVSASLIGFYEKKLKLAARLSVVSCILSVITAASSFIIAGLHSFI
jgi:ABC-type transport system involved in cytochrome c biogenesis permease subunit